MSAARSVAGGLAAAALLSWAAAAQAEDPSARYDVDDALHRHPHDVSELPSAEEARGRAITFEAAVRGSLSTNAGASRFDRIETGYATPALSLDVTPVTVGGWDLGGGAMLDADYYPSDYDDELGEGRFEAFAFAERDLGPGSFTAELIGIRTYDNDFSDQDFDLAITDLTYSVSRGGVDAEVSAEYHASDVPELRRLRLTARVGHTLAERPFGHEVTVEGDLAFSDFDGGANATRNDVTAALVLIAEREFGRGLSLKWEAAFVNRFSNRDRSRFTALDLGVEIVKAF